MFGRSFKYSRARILQGCPVGCRQPAKTLPGVSKHLLTCSQHWQVQVGIRLELLRGSPQLHCDRGSGQGVQGCAVQGSPERQCCCTAQFCYTPHPIFRYFHAKKRSVARANSVSSQDEGMWASPPNQYGVPCNRKCYC